MLRPSQGSGTGQGKFTLTSQGPAGHRCRVADAIGIEGERRTMNERGGAGGPYGGATQAEMRLPSRDLHADLSFFGETLGFRLETIFPADDPAVAVMAGHGLRIRLERGADEAPGAIRLRCEHPDRFAGGETELRAPNGTRIEIRPAGPAFARPPTRHALVVQRLDEGGSWKVGRAGMHYRDLIPGRLGGAVIASHIRIPGRRAGAGHGALPHHHLSAHLLLPRLVRPGLRGSGTPVSPGSGRLRDSALADPPSGAGVIGPGGGDRAGRTRRTPDHHRSWPHPAHRRP